MTYDTLKAIINSSYSNFTYNCVVRNRLGSDVEFSSRNLYFVKAIYKVLMNQSGDETLDMLSKEDIQKIISLFNIYAKATNPIEYS